MTTHDNGFCAIIAFKQALNKVAFVIRTPVGFFGVVHLHGMLAFQINGNGKVGGWILIRTSGLLDVARHVDLTIWFCFIDCKHKLEEMVKLTCSYLQNL